MFSEICAWEFDDESKWNLGVGLYLAGVKSLVLCSWIIVAFVKSNLIDDRSHLMLLNASLACMARTLMGGFIFSGTSAIAGRWIFGSASCKLFAFLNQFITVYQIESITHMCIERYVVAKYIKNGWEMTTDRYALFIGLCWSFSTLYSVLPLLGVGGYSWNLSCSACSLSLVLPAQPWLRYGFVTLLLLQGVKPLFFMWSMLYWARQIESQEILQKEYGNQSLLTQSTMKITWAIVLCWAPSFLAGGWLVVAQLVTGGLIQLPEALVMASAFGSEIAPAVTVSAAFWSNLNVRQAMLGLFDSESHNKQS